MIRKIETFVSHLQIVGDVRQISDSNNIERAAGKTKKNLHYCLWQPMG